MQSKARQAVLLAALVSVVPVRGLAADSSLGVVEVDAEGHDTASAELRKLRKAEVVRTLARAGNDCVVQRIEYPPAWESLSEAEIQEAQRPLSVPCGAIVSLTRFVRVNKWDVRARPAYNACDGSCDGGTGYKFRSDGSFAATVYGGEKEQKLSGHLYSYKNLVWARVGSKWRASRYSIFYTNGERAICDNTACQE
jgi:hypothetical protein